MMPMRAALAMFALLAACGPVSREAAERNCLAQAKAATGPHGEVAIGASSNGGLSTRLELDISTDALAGRDPAQVYDACVYRQSGQLPSRPLYSRPDWRP